MLLNDAMDRISYACHDIANTYTDERYLEFINTSMQRAYSLLLAGGFPPLLSETTLHDGDRLPKNYLRSCGIYPIRITSNVVKFTNEDEESIRFRYVSSPIPLTLDDEYLPFDHDAINEVIVKGALLLAINEDEYDITNDKAFLAELEAALKSAMTGVGV